MWGLGPTRSVHAENSRLADLLWGVLGWPVCLIAFLHGRGMRTGVW